MMDVEEGENEKKMYSCHQPLRQHQAVTSNTSFVKRLGISTASI